MATDGIDPEQMTEEELRAAYEAEVKRVRVEHVLLETVVTLVNLGMRRTGLMPGTEDERDPEQVSTAVESVRALLPMIEQFAPEQAQPIKEALSQLQMAYVQSIGESPAGSAVAAGAPGGSAAPGASGALGAEPEQPKPGEPGPAQKSGRLWIPGQ